VAFDEVGKRRRVSLIDGKKEAADRVRFHITIADRTQNVEIRVQRRPISGGGNETLAPVIVGISSARDGDIGNSIFESRLKVLGVREKHVVASVVNYANIHSPLYQLYHWMLES